MKKILFALCAVLIMVLSACSGDNAEKVSEKIDNKEQLSQEDYGVMIDYMGKGLDMAMKRIENATDIKDLDLKDMEKEIEKEMPYVQKFGSTLNDHISDLDTTNKEKYQKMISEFMSKAFEIATKKQLELQKK